MTEPTLTPAPLPPSTRVHKSIWRDLLQSFLDSGAESSIVEMDDRKLDNLADALRRAQTAGGFTSRVTVTQRGGGVYLVRKVEK